MLIGQRLRTLRERASLSQGDVEKRTGLLRCYISRVENCHSVPSLETLEKFAAALGVPLYELFFEGDESPAAVGAGAQSSGKAPVRDTRSDGESRYLEKVRRLVEHIDEKDHALLLYVAQKLANR
jgi:transcriptional regulator with XRE-family HTH domain